MRAVDLDQPVADRAGADHGQVARDVTPPQIVGLGAYKKRLQWRVIDTETPYITLVVKLKSGRTVRLERMPLKGWYRMPKRAVGALVRVIDTSGNATEQRAG